MKYLITFIFLLVSFVAFPQCPGSITQSNDCLSPNVLDSYDPVGMKQNQIGDVWYNGYFIDCVSLDISELNGEVTVSIYTTNLCGSPDTVFTMNSDDSSDYVLEYCQMGLDGYVNIQIQPDPNGVSCFTWEPVPPYLSTPMLLNLYEAQEDNVGDWGSFHKDDKIERWYSIYDITGRQVNRFYGFYNDALQYLDYMGIFVVYNEERHESYRVVKY